MHVWSCLSNVHETLPLGSMFYRVRAGYMVQPSLSYPASSISQLQLKHQAQWLGSPMLQRLFALCSRQYKLQLPMEPTWLPLHFFFQFFQVCIESNSFHYGGFQHLFFIFICLPSPLPLPVLLSPSFWSTPFSQTTYFFSPSHNLRAFTFHIFVFPLKKFVYFVCVLASFIST